MPEYRIQCLILQEVVVNEPKPAQALSAARTFLTAEGIPAQYLRVLDAPNRPISRWVPMSEETDADLAPWDHYPFALADIDACMVADVKPLWERRNEIQEPEPEGPFLSEQFITELADAIQTNAVLRQAIRRVFP